jgi:hypothetical protein
VVAQITWVRVRETVPDAVLERADEVELVDLPPDALLERLREGKVYLPEQALRGRVGVLPQGQPAGAARAGAAAHGPAGRQRRAGVPARARDRDDVARGGADPRGHRAERVGGAAGAGRRPHGGRAARGVGGGVRRDAGPGDRGEADRGRSASTSGWPSRWAPRS